MDNERKTVGLFRRTKRGLEDLHLLDWIGTIIWPWVTAIGPIITGLAFAAWARLIKLPMPEIAMVGLVALAAVFVILVAVQSFIVRRRNARLAKARASAAPASTPSPTEGRATVPVPVPEIAPAAGQPRITMYADDFAVVSNEVEFDTNTRSTVSVRLPLFIDIPEIEFVRDFSSHYKPRLIDRSHTSFTATATSGTATGTWTWIAKGKLAKRAE